jgi:hypothetical protein
MTAGIADTHGWTQIAELLPRVTIGQPATGA